MRSSPRPWNGTFTVRDRSAIALCWISLVVSPARADVVFFNDFEFDTAGLVAGGSLPALTRALLPIDSGGPTSINKSMWLGKLGDGIGKSGAIDETVTLPLTGLTPGTVYSVSFDLLIGASWDGAAGGYGPDSWRFAVDGTRFIDTIFSNVQAGVDAGAYSPQRYTDTQYTNPNGPDVPRFSGAEASYYTVPGYANDYAIYHMGYGPGNPILNFQATAATAMLEFAALRKYGRQRRRVLGARQRARDRHTHGHGRGLRRNHDHSRRQRRVHRLQRPRRAEQRQFGFLWHWLRWATRDLS